MNDLGFAYCFVEKNLGTSTRMFQNLKISKNFLNQRIESVSGHNLPMTSVKKFAKISLELDLYSNIFFCKTNKNKRARNPKKLVYLTGYSQKLCWNYEAIVPILIFFWQGMSFDTVYNKGLKLNYLNGPHFGDLDRLWTERKYILFY